MGMGGRTDNDKDKLVLLKVKIIFLLFICTFLQQKYEKKNIGVHRFLTKAACNRQLTWRKVLAVV